MVQNKPTRKPTIKKQNEESIIDQDVDNNYSFTDNIENWFLENTNFISSLLGEYSQKLEENINKMIQESNEETKGELNEEENMVNNKMIKIMEEEDEYLETDSNEDDSNSDPSEDNFSEGEINEWFNKVIYN